MPIRPGVLVSRVRLITVVAIACGALLSATAQGAPVLVADRVDSSGRLIGETTHVNPSVGSVTEWTSSLHEIPPAQGGDHPTAVIRIALGGVEPAASEAALQAVVFGSTDSVSDFYAESSFGRLTLSGTVLPTVSLPAVTECDVRAIARDALAALQADGYAVSGDGTDGYRHYLYVFPRVSACGWAGLAEVGGNEMWINDVASRYVISHEFGHNLGLKHANAIRCTDASGQPAMISATCIETEYADPYETMGSRGVQLSAVSRQLLGLLDARQQIRVTTDQTVTLETVSADGGGVKSIEIPRPGTNDSWFVEMRSTSGYDTFASSSNVTSGILIRRRTNQASGLTPTQLIDANPATADLNDAALTPGRRFSDPVGKVAIELLSRSGASASVRISFPSTTTATQTTTAPVMVTTRPKVARSWPSKIVLYRRRDGRLAVRAARVARVGGGCVYRVRARTSRHGRCTRLVSGRGWKIGALVRAGGYVIVALRVPGGRVLVSRKVRTPNAKGRYIIYRLL